MATYDQKYRLYRISPEKPLNKQQQQQTTTTSNSNNNKPCKGGNMIYDIIKTIQFSTKKYKTCKETGNNGLYTVGGGRVVNRNLDIWLVKQRFLKSYNKYIQRIKRNHLSKIKGRTEKNITKNRDYQLNYINYEKKKFWSKKVQ